MSKLPINIAKSMLSIVLILIYVHSILSIRQISRNDIARGSGSAIHVISASSFPHMSDDVFQIVFSEREGNYPPSSLMMVLIMDMKTQEKKGSFLFYPDRTAQPLSDTTYFVRINSAHFDNQSIVISIIFTPAANNHLLVIRYGEYDSVNQMTFAQNNYRYMDKKFSSLITLIVRTKLKVTTLTLDGRNDGVIRDEPGYCSCRGFGGLPLYRVRLDNLERFEILTNDIEEYDQGLNEVKKKVRFKMENHGDTFLCYTENSLKVATVNVFHHPTKVYLEPRYYNSMPNGSQVICKAEDGFPEPEFKWELVKGPPNEKLYYNTHKAQLNILPEAPIGSEWQFRCVAWNAIPYNQINNSTYTFKFTIVNSNSNVLVLAAASIGSLVALLALLVGVFLIIRPNSGARNRSANRRRQNNSNRADSAETKELGFDPDTLINSTKSLCDSTASGLNTKPATNTTTPTNTLPKPIQPMKSILVNSNANQKEETKLANQNATSIPIVTTITTNHKTTITNNNTNDNNNKINSSPDSFGAPAYDEITVDSHGNMTKPPPPLPTNRSPYQQQMAQNSVTNTIESNHTTMTNDSDNNNNNNNKIINNKDEIYDQTTKDDKPASYV